MAITSGTFSFVQASEILYGRDLKAQASVYFRDLGISAELLISENRAYYPCSSELVFSPRIQNNWQTIEVFCADQNWKVSLRTTASNNPLNKKEYKGDENSSIVITLSKNISKGEVITKEHLMKSPVASTQTYNSFSQFRDLIGRKSKVNIARGSIVKPRHVEYLTSVAKNDTVVVVVGNENLSVTTYGLALESGQVGDMLKIKNINSNKIFDAIVLDEKKVAPLTNM